MVFPIVAALGLVAEFAPGLIKQFAGDKAGEVAEKVAGLAMSVTGEQDIDSAAAALRANPELALQFKTRAAEIEVELVKIAAEDRKDARAMATNLAASGHAMAWAPAVVSVIIVAAFGLMLYSIISGTGIPDGSKDIASVMLGTLGALAIKVGDYWLGSSAGSKQKTNLLSGAAK